MSESSDYRKDQAERQRRRDAWTLLQNTRNPEYVALKFDYPVEKMRDALAKIPEPISAGDHVRSAAACNVLGSTKRIVDLIPETLRRSRVPGEDDDKQ